MFEATGECSFFDYFRIPYHHADDKQAGPYRKMWRSGTETPRLAWPDAAAARGPRGAFRLGDLPIFARLADERTAARARSAWGSGWRITEVVTDAAGRPAGAVWRDEAGNVQLPFDPAQVISQFVSERYQDAARGSAWRVAQSALVRAYYLARPAIPRRAQIAMRRLFARMQRQAVFPAFPVETALHDFYEWMFQLVTALAGEPVPWLGPWPGGRRWAMVLTHDVETAAGLAALDTLRAVERETGDRSSWNFVPLRYRTDEAVTTRLREEGCEIGVHGLLHDGRDLASRRLLRRRLPQIRAYARRWDAAGFRSPATQRSWDLMPLLGFAYDTSYHDTAPYEPKPGGSCSYLPYFIGDMVELPITLPMDHTLFDILRHPDASVWLAKAEYLREHGGMALALTHPDYAHDQRVTDGYRRLLGAYHDDPTVWRALPREVAEWWQRRAVSTVEPDGAGWVVRGPAAADGTVRTCLPGRPALGPAG